MLTQKEHKERHQELHRCFDELIADYITQTGKRLSNSTALEIMEWSYAQTKNPTETPHSQPYRPASPSQAIT